jgi:trehalose/maltose hydrolase-like predicted phosphorylase
MSLVVFSHILYPIDPEESWKLYKEFIMSDVCDLQGGTTAEGIHVAMMAASINMLLYKLCGIDITGFKVFIVTLMVW